MNLRVLTVADLHQSWPHYHWLRDEVQAKRPDVVAFVGDVLNDPSISQRDRVATAEAAELLSKLPCPQLVFVRGNHEQEDWPKFVAAWPLHEPPTPGAQRYCPRFRPARNGWLSVPHSWEAPWCATLPRVGNEITDDFMLSGRDVLPIDHEFWLPPLIQRLGPAGRALWLMHEPPQVRKIARAAACNPETWRTQSRPVCGAPRVLQISVLNPGFSKPAKGPVARPAVEVEAPRAEAGPHCAAIAGRAGGAGPNSRSKSNSSFPDPSTISSATSATCKPFRGIEAGSRPPAACK